MLKKVLSYQGVAFNRMHDVSACVVVATAAVVNDYVSKGLHKTNISYKS